MTPTPDDDRQAASGNFTFWSQRPTRGHRLRLWLALAFILWAGGPWGPAQPYWRLSAAFRHLPRVETALKQYPELATVKVGVPLTAASLVCKGSSPAPNSANWSKRWLRAPVPW